MLLALLLLLAATTAALEQDGKDYDLYTTASALRNLAGGFASEVEVTADGRVKKLIFDGTADLLAEARALVNALGVTQGEGCEDRDCAAKELVNMMRGTVDARRRTAGEALDLAQLRIATTTRGHFHVVHTRYSFVGASLEAAGTFEEPALRLMLAVVRPGDVVVDAGANLGAHLVPLAVQVVHPLHDLRGEVRDDGLGEAAGAPEEVGERAGVHVLQHHVDGAVVVESPVELDDVVAGAPKPYVRATHDCAGARRRASSGGQGRGGRRRTPRARGES